MATVINNAQPVRLEAGGIFAIIDGATTYELQTRESGAVEVMQGGNAVLRYNNLGTPKVPLLGDGQRSTIKGKCKVTTELATATTGIMALSQAEDTTNGLFKTYTVTLSWPAKKDGTTGDTVTFTECYFVKPAEIKEGTEFDVLEFEIESTQRKGTLGTY